MGTSRHDRPVLQSPGSWRSLQALAVASCAVPLAVLGAGALNRTPPLESSKSSGGLFSARDQP
jgi:hypothetical protein